MSSDYIARNEGFMTASKLLEFQKSPELFFKKYVKKELPEEKESKALKMGTCFDDWWSLGDLWNDKYHIPPKLKADFAGKLLEAGHELSGNEKVDELKDLYFQAYEDKVFITEAEFETIKGMIAEVHRQPLMDCTGEYESQKEITAMFKGKLPLKCTLDRLSLEKKLLRDWKTSGQIDRFNWDWQKYHYDFKMAFYYGVVEICTGVSCDAYLDVVSTNAPYASSVYKLQSQQLRHTLNQTIVPLLNRFLDTLIGYEKTKGENVWLQPIAREELFSDPHYFYLQSTIQTEPMILS